MALIEAVGAREILDSRGNPTVEVEVHEYEVLPDDVYLLCSDGLPDMVEDEDIPGFYQADEEFHGLLMEFTAGYGFVGIAVALMGRNHPFGIFLAALLFGLLYLAAWVGLGALAGDVTVDNLTSPTRAALASWGDRLEAAREEAPATWGAEPGPRQ